MVLMMLAIDLMNGTSSLIWSVTSPQAVIPLTSDKVVSALYQTDGCRVLLTPRISSRCIVTLITRMLRFEDQDEDDKEEPEGTVGSYS